MATTKATQGPASARRSERKRAAILAAAETLFVTAGYEPTSVDAIAQRADVSKRTVYDHFGTKEALYLSVLRRSHEAMEATVRTAIDEELTPDRELRDALKAFAMRITTEMFPSSIYVTFRRLNTQARAAPRLPDEQRNNPERLLEQRFTRLAADGQLRTSTPDRAAQHFTALTLLLALNTLDEAPASASGDAEIHAIIEDGVDAFLRAYR